MNFDDMRYGKEVDFLYDVNGMCLSIALLNRFITEFVVKLGVEVGACTIISHPAQGDAYRALIASITIPEEFELLLEYDAIKRVIKWIEDPSFPPDLLRIECSKGCGVTKNLSYIGLFHSQ